MNFSEEEITEFRTEALELLDSAEDALLQLDRGGEFRKNYDSIFRVFHSLKGGGGMLGLTEIQNHMHKLENLLSETKARNGMTKSEISLFLRGVDAGRRILAGEKVDFSYATEEDAGPEAQPVAAEPPLAPAPMPESRAPAPGQQPVSVSPEAAPPVRTGKAPTVYILDDEPGIVDALLDLLSTVHLDTKGFTKGPDLIEAVKLEKPDAIISDYVMPEMSGIEVLKEIHGIDPEIPVIFLSGFLTKEILMEGIENGVYATLEKPFRASDIIQHCLNAVRQSQLIQSMNRTMNLVTYQFSDLDDYLKSQGKEEIRATLRNEVMTLIENRRLLRDFFRSRYSKKK